MAGDRGILERFGVWCVREAADRRRDCFHFAGVWEPRGAAGGPRGAGRARKFPRAGRPGCGHSGDVAAEPPRAGRRDGALWTALRGSCRPRRPSRAVETRTQGCWPIFTEICALPGALGGSRGGAGGGENLFFLIFLNADI